MHEPVKTANQSFYDAFCALDLNAMNGVWSHTPDVVAIHPGWPILRGWSDVQASWRDIFSNCASMTIQPTDVEITVTGPVARVSCIENLLTVMQGQSIHGRIACTNLFHRVDGVWRMVLHHGSPMSLASGNAPIGDA